MSVKSVTIEELEKLIKDEPVRKKRTPEDPKTVINFIQDFQITRGDIKVPTYLIFFEYYNNFSRHARNRKYKRNAFFRLFSEHFEQVRTCNQRYYLLNDCFDLSKENLERAYNHCKISRKRNGTKKIKKN